MDEEFTDSGIRRIEELSVGELNQKIESDMLRLKQAADRRQHMNKVSFRWLRGAESRPIEGNASVKMMLEEVEKLRNIKDKDDPRYERAANFFINSIDGEKNN